MARLAANGGLCQNVLVTTTNDPLHQLAQRAETTVAAQEAHSTAMAAQAAAVGQRSSRFQHALLLVLVLIWVASMALQWRALREPFQTAVPGESAAAAEADLRAIAIFVDAFQFSQGRYPDTLSEVRLPDGMAALVRDHGVRYQRTDAGYTLQWMLPAQQLVYDGVTGETRHTPTKQP